MTTTVGELMSTHLVTLNEHNTVHEAREVMAMHHIRHIPIVSDGNEFVGLLTQRDVLATTVSVLAEVAEDEMDRLEDGIPIREVMTTDVVAVARDMDARDAGRHLLETKHGCLPVVARGSLVGLVTESDFIALAIRLLDRQEQAVSA